MVMECGGSSCKIHVGHFVFIFSGWLAGAQTPALLLTGFLVGAAQAAPYYVYSLLSAVVVFIIVFDFKLLSCLGLLFWCWLYRLRLRLLYCFLFGLLCGFGLSAAS